MLNTILGQLLAMIINVATGRKKTLVIVTLLLTSFIILGTSAFIHPTRAHLGLTNPACPNANQAAFGPLWVLTAVNPGPGAADTLCVIASAAGGTMDNAHFAAPGDNPCSPAGNVGATGNEIWADWEAVGDCVPPGGVVRITFQCGNNNCTPPDSVEWWQSTNGKNGFVPGTATLQLASSIGGEIVPVNKFDLLAPYIGLTFLIVAAMTVSALYVRRAKRKIAKK